MNECKAQLEVSPRCTDRQKGGVGSSGIFLRSNKSEITKRHFTNVIKRNIVGEGKAKQLHL
jgi:hypothetical protein